MSSHIWNAADGPAPDFSARGALEAFRKASRSCNDRLKRGFFIGVDPAATSSYELKEGLVVLDRSESNEKIVRGFSLESFTVDRAVDASSIIESINQQRTSSNSTMFDEKDEDAESSNSSSSEEDNKKSGKEQKDNKKEQSSSLQAGKPVKIRYVQCDKDLWNATWGTLFENDDVMDDISVANPRDKNCCVIIRCTNRARVEDGNTGSYSNGGGRNSGSGSFEEDVKRENAAAEKMVSDFKTAVSAQARACGPVEFLRCADAKSEITVQFTTESSARLFVATFTGPAACVSGLAERLKKEGGWGSVTATMAPTQMKAPSFGNNNNNMNRRRGGGAGGGRGGGMNNNSAPEEIFLSLAAAAGRIEDKAEGEDYYRNGEASMLLELEYAKALFDAVGGRDVEMVLALTDEDMAKEKITLSRASAFDEEQIRKLVVKFRALFNSQEEKMKALHLLQWPLRQLFGLALF